MKYYYHLTEWNPRRRLNIVFSFYPADYCLGFDWRKGYTLSVTLHIPFFTMCISWQKKLPEFINPPLQEDEILDRNLKEAAEYSKQDQ